jgi:hypothetical protein
MQDFVSGKVDIAVESAAQVKAPVVWGGRFTEISRQNRDPRRLCRGVGHDGFDERVLLRFTHAKPLASSTSGHRCGARLLPLRGRWSSEIWRPTAWRCSGRQHLPAFLIDGHPHDLAELPRRTPSGRPARARRGDRGSKWAAYGACAGRLASVAPSEAGQPALLAQASTSLSATTSAAASSATATCPRTCSPRSARRCSGSARGSKPGAAT